MAARVFRALCDGQFRHILGFIQPILQP
jgi:hypothetical protein